MASTGSAGGFGAMDLIAVLAVLFLVLLAAVRDFPLYAAKSGPPAARATPTAPGD